MHVARAPRCLTDFGFLHAPRRFTLVLDPLGPRSKETPSSLLGDAMPELHELSCLL